MSAQKSGRKTFNEIKCACSVYTFVQKRFRVMSNASDVNSWMCSRALVVLNYFVSMKLDDSSFQNCILNTGDLQNVYSDKFLFNPFDMNNEESSFSPVIDNDPDIINFLFKHYLFIEDFTRLFSTR